MNTEHPSILVDKLLEVVPDEHKSELDKLKNDFLYKAPELWAECRYELMFHCQKLLIDEEWKLKMVSVYTGLPTDKIGMVLKD